MNAACWLLTPLAIVYAGAMRGRNLYYERVHSAVRAAGVPVISVGNLTTGGTGKTPLVIELARRLVAFNRHPAILTRGYRAHAREAADEVQEFQNSHLDTPVIVNPDRVAGAAAAIAQGADCLIMDDGFQHRRLARDLDIVLIDALQPWGHGWVLPAGRLREPLSSLRRADVFVITRANQTTPENVVAIADQLQAYGDDKLIVEAEVQAEALVGQDGRRRPTTDLGGRRVLAVCGIGNPQTFEKLLRALSVTVSATLTYADHHRYRVGDIDAISAAARRVGAELVVTTRKDWVKLAPLWSTSAVDLLRLDVRPRFTIGAEEFDTRLRRALGLPTEAQRG